MEKTRAAGAVNYGIVNSISMAGNIAFGSWARYFTLSTQVYK